MVQEKKTQAEVNYHKASMFFGMACIVGAFGSVLGLISGTLFWLLFPNETWTAIPVHMGFGALILAFPAVISCGWYLFLMMLSQVRDALR